MKSAIIFLLAAIAWPALAADGKQDLDGIRELVREFVAREFVTPGDDAQVELGQLDSRLKLAPCAADMAAFLPTAINSRRNITVGVRCRGAQPWKLFVPVTIKRIEPVVVLTRPVSRGATISAADIRVEKRDTSQLVSGYYSRPAAVIGKTLKRSAMVGRPLNSLAVGNPTTIRRGDKVTLLAHAASFEIRVEGEALQAGAVGDRIQVRNLSSRRAVSGTVVADRLVKVRL